MENDNRKLARKKLQISRRRFLRAVCAAGLGLNPVLGSAAKKSGKMRLRVIYVLSAVKQKSRDWPNLGFDFAPEMEKVNHALAGAFPEIEFLPVTAKGPLQAEKILLQDMFSNIDGYIVDQMNSLNLVVPFIAGSGKPVLYTHLQFAGTGGFLINNAMLMRSKARNVGFVSSSRVEDLVEAVKCFEMAKNSRANFDFAKAVAQSRRQLTKAPGDLSCTEDPLELVDVDECLRRAGESKILAVGYPGVSMSGVPLIPMEMVSYTQLNAACKAADQEQARAIADRWQKSAEAVVDVSEDTLLSSAAMYLGMKNLLQKHKANAITINCLVGFYGGLIHAYPCLGFHELLNEGLVGACECDVRSAATMLLVNALTNGRPGYISDPELDSYKRSIIYAHCVATNRPFGPKGPANPFQILTHSEDRKGAAVRSLLPAGYMTTTLEFMPERRQVLIHQAKTIGNDPEDRACRTKLVAEPIGDFEKLFTQWDRWGWHRVTVYGDLKQPVSALAEAMGYKLVQEA